MFKKIITSLTVSAAFVLPLGIAQAQTVTHDNHDGHNHSTSQRSAPDLFGNISPTVTATHVFTAALDDHVIGKESAPHTLIVYASVVCGHCATWFINDYPVIKKKLIDKGKLRLVFREFPTQPSQVAVAGFQIANCAPEKDYFKNITHQFENQKETFDRLKKGEGLTRFLELANAAGIETEEDMQACFKNQDGLSRIERSLERAQAGGIDAVPALILDERPMPGLNGAKEVLMALGEL